MPLVSKLFIFILFSSVNMINGQLNCSEYNPCGRNGYCRNGKDGQWSCQCKFWWNGTLCDDQTSSGKQVIALGCILGFFIVIFHGIQIILCLKRRRQRRQAITPQRRNQTSQKSKLVDLVLENAKTSANIYSILITVATIILAAAGLIGKWSLLQPIHDEIVYKYITNQSVYFTTSSFCQKTIVDQFSIITIPVACFLIVMLIISTKRTSLLPTFLHGYGGVPMPIDFLSHVDRKYAAFVFAVCADELLNIMEAVIFGSARKAEGVILTFLLRVLDVIIMGLRYYVLLACVYLNTLFILICATIYVWLDFSISTIVQGMCKPEFYPSYESYRTNSSAIDTIFKYYGTGSNIIIVILFTDIPRFVCLAYVNIKLPMLLAKKIYLTFKKNVPLEKRILLSLSREQRIFFHISEPNSVEMLYVKNLFRSRNKHPPSQSIFARLIPKFIYEWRDDYRFSARVVCVYSSILLLLYQIIIRLCIEIIPRLVAIEDSFQQIVTAFVSIFYILSSNNDGVDATDPNTSDFPVPHLVRSYIAAVFLTATLTSVQLLVLLANIRRNIIQSYRGDDTEIPRRQRADYVSYATGNFHFAGYFIGYLIWGVILMAVFSLIICMAVDGFITFGSVPLVEKILKLIIPSVLLVIFKLYLNKILAQYIFLQHYGEVLSLNNRRSLMIFIYFNFFLDAFLGFISSIIRLIQSLIGGIIYMSRLDYSPLGRKLETMDGGFSAYCGFIHTECTHRHPVMLVCVSHLYTEVKKKELRMKMMNSYDLSADEKNQIKFKSQSKYVRKWKLAVFLTQNPILVFFRKSFLNQLPTDEIRYVNDLDNDNNRNHIQKTLSIYARRKSVAQLSTISETDLKYYEENRF